MSSLSVEQLEDAYVDLGFDYGQVFSPSELNRFYTRAGGDYDKSLVYAVRSLLADSAKLHNYSAAQSSESVGQVFDHYKALLGLFEERAGFGGAKLGVGNLVLNLDSDEDNLAEWDGTNESSG